MATTTRKSRARRNAKVVLVKATAEEIIAGMGITQRELRIARAALAASKRRTPSSSRHATK